MNEHEAVLSRVSRLLHDDVSQVLSAVGLQLDAMRMDFREQAPGVDGRATEIQELLEQAIEQLRDITNELNPSIVERAGLQFALDRLIGKTRAGFSGTLRLHFDASLRRAHHPGEGFLQDRGLRARHRQGSSGMLADRYSCEARARRIRARNLRQWPGGRRQSRAFGTIADGLLCFQESRDARTERAPGKGSVDPRQLSAAGRGA